MTKVQMTQEQLGHIQSMKHADGWNLTKIFTTTFRSTENRFINDLSEEEVGTAYLFPKKVEIIQPEIIGREAMNALFQGEEIEFQCKGYICWGIVNKDTALSSFKDEDFNWRKAVKS